MIYDEEIMLKDLETAFKNDLNGCIDAINTEKGESVGDPLYIPNIPTDKYKFETLDRSMNGYKGFFIMYGISDTPIKDQQVGNYIEDLTVSFEVCCFDDGQKDMRNKFYQLLRYRRALKSVVEKNPEVFRSYAKPLIGSLKPSTFPMSRNVVILSIGIEIKASVTAN